MRLLFKLNFSLIGGLLLVLTLLMVGGRRGEAKTPFLVISTGHRNADDWRLTALLPGTSVKHRLTPPFYDTRVLGWTGNADNATSDWLYFTGSDGWFEDNTGNQLRDIHRIRADGKGYAKVVESVIVRSIVWSPDRSWLLYAAPANTTPTINSSHPPYLTRTDLYRLDTTTGLSQNLTAHLPTGIDARRLPPLPNQTHTAWSFYAYQSDDRYRVDAMGVSLMTEEFTTAPRPGDDLVDLPLEARFFLQRVWGWSPDGKWLVYENFGGAIERASSDWTRIETLLQSSPDINWAFVGWSPAATMGEAWLYFRQLGPRGRTQLQRMQDNQPPQLVFDPPDNSWFVVETWTPPLELSWQAGVVGSLGGGLMMGGIFLGRRKSFLGEGV